MEIYGRKSRETGPGIWGGLKARGARICVLHHSPLEQLFEVYD
jgi:hypothetical protein